jgi:uncharacterized membrane protein YeaQ/YmgE (transglycosylase-associated protein family)
MNINLWFAIGIVVGLLATRFLEKSRWRTEMNVVVGIVGAVVGGFVIAPMMGAGSVELGITAVSLLASLLGALLLLGFFNFVRPRG